MSEPRICPTCGVGMDTDGDGDCAFCGPSVMRTRKLQAPSIPRKSLAKMTNEEFAEALADLAKVGAK